MQTDKRSQVYDSIPGLYKHTVLSNKKLIYFASFGAF